MKVSEKFGKVLIKIKFRILPRDRTSIVTRLPFDSAAALAGTPKRYEI